jgi:hypothetical protein
MAFLTSIVSWLQVKRIEQINLYKTYPFDIQAETLYKLLQMGQDTEWGKMHNFEAINNYEDFKKATPITDYNSLKPYITRIMNGEQNILWPTPIKWFAKSSGTTEDKSKFIPVSKEALEECHFRGGKDVYSLYTNIHPETTIYNGKALALGGSHEICNMSADSYYGDLSAILMQNLPFWVEFYRTPDLSIALMDEWERKLELMALETMNEDVTHLAGVPSWTLVLFKKILEITGKSTINEVWPNFELFIHGGVNFAPYREQFEKILPSDKTKYFETYNASEGFFAIQDDLNSDDMLLMLDLGIFYEFIPIQEIHKKDPIVISLEDVQIGENYALIISTNSGLWRYMIGDTVSFTQKFPYKLKITGRTKHFMNAFGEEVIIENADNALRFACEKTGAIISEYTAAPLFMGENNKGSHQWLIEFEKMPEEMHVFTDSLDVKLKSINSDYEAKRYKDIALTKPQVISMKKGVFYEWMKFKGKLGGQHKVPRLANNRTIADEIILINEKL